MDWSFILQQFIQLISSELFIGFSAFIFISTLFLIINKKPKWSEYGDMLYGIFNIVEKSIPDMVENKSIKKLDLFLKKACEAYKSRTGKEAPEDFKQFCKNKVEVLVFNKNIGK